MKHVTTNNVTADQAVIAGHVTTGSGRAVSPALLAASAEAPILNETRRPDPVGGGGEIQKRNEHQPHAKRPRRSSVQSQIETNRIILPRACGARLSCLSDAWSGWWCAEQ
ncbi:hypothetical protein [Bradyrhizobium sp. AZCC 2230]|uniref:hypothetical protein n=1 Tax=Bradyrhizobium sp. AZCC 2230 TaxID=3117021 RepID=UPI002FF26B7A